MTASRPRETDLYAPVKALLEAQGYEVKGEIGAADVVGVRDGDEVVVVELKISFSLAVFHQAIERQKLTDIVYVAVARGSGKLFRKSLLNNKTLCRRLGLGLITVRSRDNFAEIHLDPAPYTPRKTKVRKTRLLREFSRLVGDPNTGGAARQGLMTAYRQDALRCVMVLDEFGPLKAALVSKTCGVELARRIMADNHYGWFERVATGIYALSPKGNTAKSEYEAELKILQASSQKNERR